MNQGDQGGVWGRRNYVVMMFDDRDDIRRKLPMLGKDLATVTMRKSQHLLLTRFQSDTFLTCCHDAHSILFRARHCVYENTQIVQQAGKVRLLRLDIPN